MTTDNETKAERPKRLTALPEYVVKAMERLIVEEMETSNPGRFARVAAVAELAQQIASLYHLRVEDVGDANMVNAEMGMPQIGGGMYNGPIRARRNPYMEMMGNRPQAADDVVRDFVSTMMPLVRGLQLGNALQLTDRAAEFGLDAATLYARVRELASTVHETTTPAPTAPAPVKEAPASALPILAGQ